MEYKQLSWGGLLPAVVSSRPLKRMNIEQVQGLDGEVPDAAILIANVVLQQAQEQVAKQKPIKCINRNTTFIFA